LSEHEDSVLRERLEHLRQQLREELAGGSEAGATVELDQTRVGRLSRMDALQAQAMSKETSRRTGVRLAMVDVAVARVDSGEYGYCDQCGELINPKRLDVDPLAMLCIECASRNES
jgi:DnaK suppressor protein